MTLSATAFGHLHQEQQNLQSTKDVASEQDFFQSSDKPNKKLNQMHATLDKLQAVQKAYSDLTGRFSYSSSRGNQYFLVVYDYDSNAMVVKVLKSRYGTKIKKKLLLINLW